MKKIFSLAFLVMAVSLVLSFGLCDKAFAATKYDDYLYYSVKNGSVTITDCEDTATSIVIPSKINGLPVTSIGWFAFASCDSLTSITIPDSVTSIGAEAFSGCDGLISIIIPNSVTYIGVLAFSGCDSLESVYITDIAAWCNIDFDERFSDRIDLTYCANPLYYADKLYVNGKLVSNVVIPEGVTKIPVYAFSCDNLKSITIPDSVTSIGDYAFYDCISLANITIPDSVTSIGERAFYCCDRLMSITIPDSVTRIEDYTFCDCSSLRSVRIGNGVTSIGESAFSGCSSLTSMTIPDSVTDIGDSAFMCCWDLTNVTIDNGVTSIGESAFSGCSSLTSITIPNSVNSIGARAFEECWSFTKVEYGGSEEEWDEVYIGANNNLLLNAKIRYNSELAYIPAQNTLKTQKISLANTVYSFTIVPEIAKKNSFIYAAAYGNNKQLLKLSKTKMLTSGSTISVDKTNEIKYVVFYALSSDLSPVSQPMKYIFHN